MYRYGQGERGGAEFSGIPISPQADAGDERFCYANIFAQVDAGATDLADSAFSVR